MKHYESVLTIINNLYEISNKLNILNASIQEKLSRKQCVSGYFVEFKTLEGVESKLKKIDTYEDILKYIFYFIFYFYSYASSIYHYDYHKRGTECWYLYKKYWYHVYTNTYLPRFK